MIKSADTRNQAGILIKAYIEALTCSFVLRHERVRSAVRSCPQNIKIQSSYEGEHVILDAHRIVDELKGGAELTTIIEGITTAFVAGMWVLLKSHVNYDNISTEPEIQFLRHLRNACGHDGRWNFQYLKYPASWRNKVLTTEHIGQPVFHGLLKHGDVMLLFIDIDRKYFQQ